jgi:hypothetical protein
MVSLLRSPYATCSFYSFAFRLQVFPLNFRCIQSMVELDCFREVYIYVVYLVEGSDSLSGRMETWIERKVP